MAGIDEEDEFSDDVLDSLDPQDFQQLQESAYAATQVEQALPNTRQHTFNATPQAPERTNLLSSNAAPPIGARAAEKPTATEEAPMIRKEDLARLRNGPASKFKVPSLAQGLSESTQREQWRQQRYANNGPPKPHPTQDTSRNGRAPLSLPHRAGTSSQQPAREIIVNEETDSQQNGDNGGGANELQKLKHELEQMRLEKENLEKAVKAANEQVIAKTGEISIIRSNQAKTQREHEQRLEEIRRQKQEEQGRHTALLEQARKEKESLATHNQFLGHEINDQTWQLQQAQRTQRTLNRQAGESTPKKLTAVPLRDGFNDDEIMVVSPSKSGGKGKASTPRAGGKRKRDVLGTTPSQQLQVDNEGDSVVADAPPPSPAKHEAIVISKGINDDKKSLEFLQRLLDHRISRIEKRTLELLADFSLPSLRAKGTALSSLLLDEMGRLNFQNELSNYPGAVGSVIISVWSKCLDEQYYEPVYLFVDLIKFILINNHRSSAAAMLPSLVEVTQACADVNLLARYRRRLKAASAAAAPPTDLATNRPAAPPEHAESTHVDSQACLQLLDLAATVLRRDPDALARFWRAVRFDFLSMTLRPFQDPADVLVLARLLATSVRADGFAMVVAADVNQRASEAHVLDRLTAVLVHTPRPPRRDRHAAATTSTAPRPEPADDALRAEMRLQIVDAIEAISGKRYGARAVAQHPAALGRLARALHEALAALYDYRAGHDARLEVVNRATRLLHFLTAAHADAVGDLPARLRATQPTSVYKYLIALSRLAFADGAFLERGIEDDVVDAAHQMLEGLVTPEEAEELQRVFIKDV